jgi:hypothetical protein
VEATVAPAINALSSRDGRSQDHETEIVSSLQESVDDRQPTIRQKRRAIIVTITSTITSFVLTTTSVIAPLVYSSFRKKITTIFNELFFFNI